MEESLGVSLPFRLKMDFRFDSVSTRTSLSAPLRRFGDDFKRGFSEEQSSEPGLKRELRELDGEYLEAFTQHNELEKLTA